jgi:putative transposase
LKTSVGQGFSLANRKLQTNYKKRIRLKNFDYKGCYRYFVTLCTSRKQNIFCKGSSVFWLTNVLRRQSKSFKFKVWAYCFMPNHLHVLIEGKDDNSDMKKFISSFKQYTGFHYKNKFGERLWQINFYEHVLRREEDTIGVAHYIFNNPVRKGLVDDYKKYKYLGSFEFNVLQT